MSDLELEIQPSQDETQIKDIDPNALVRQSNELVNGKWRMNLNQSKIFLTGVSMLDDTDNDFQTYRIRGLQLKNLIDYKGKSSIYEVLKRDMPKLMSSYIGITKEENGKKVTEWISLVSSAKYVHGEGDLILRFAPELKPYLLDLKEKFTQFKLADTLRFKSMYTLRVYLLLKQFDNTGWRVLYLDELREQLSLNKSRENNLKKDLYPLVADLKKRVIDVAVKEMLTIDFKVQYEPIKEGRKIIGFKFVWKNMGSVGTGAPGDQTNITFNPKDASAERLLIRMRKIGLQDHQIRYIADNLEPQKVAQTSFVIWRKLQEKEIQESKIGGYSYKTFKSTHGLEKLPKMR